MRNETILYHVSNSHAVDADSEILEVPFDHRRSIGKDGIWHIAMLLLGVKTVYSIFTLQ